MVWFGSIAALVFWRPAIAITAALCTYGFEQFLQSQDFFFWQNGYIMNVATGSVIVLAISICLYRGHLRISEYPVHGWLVLLLYAWVGMTISWSINPEVSAHYALATLPYAITMVLLPPLLLREEQDVTVLFRALLVYGCAVIVLAALVSEWSYRGIQLQATSGAIELGLDRGNPLAISNLGGLVGIVAVSIYWPRLQWLLFIGRWVVLGFCVYAIILSGSRGQFIVLLVVAVAAIALIRGVASFGKIVSSGIGFLVLFGIFAWLFSAFADDDRWSLTDASSQFSVSRIEMSSTLLSEWLESGPIRWVIGIGSSASYDPGVLGIYPHVVAVEVLCELGFVGFILYALLMFITFRSMKSCYMLAGTDRSRRVAVCVLGAFFVFTFLLSFKQGSLLGSPLLLAFSVMVGRFEVSQKRSLTLAHPER